MTHFIAPSEVSMCVATDCWL